MRESFPHDAALSRYPANKSANHPLRRALARLRGEVAGQSLVELAAALPALVLLMAYAVDYGYFFIAMACLTSSARDAVQYASMGYNSPAQTSLPAAGPMSSAASVSGEALAGLTTFVNSSTTASVQVCSQTNGLSGNVARCTSYGPSATSYTPATDPEAPHFVLQRVDITYTIQPPIPIKFFTVGLFPTMKFHEQASMRAMD